jgi:exonuclease VII small subunit
MNAPPRKRKDVVIDTALLDWIDVNLPGVALSHLCNEMLQVLRERMELQPTLTLEEALASFQNG